MRSSRIAARRELLLVLWLTHLLFIRTAWAQQANTSGEDPDTDKTAEASAASVAANSQGSTEPEETIQGATESESAETPVNLRLRQLEQRVQALKERAWRAKARVGMLKEAVLGGGVGATLNVVHKSRMGNSFRLVHLLYALDGTQVFARKDQTDLLNRNQELEILAGPIAPGSHTISVLAVYRGHGYGVFKYLTKYKFTIRSSHTFTVSDNKATRIEVIAFERGGVTTPLEDRPAIDFKVSHSQSLGEN